MSIFAISFRIHSDATYQSRYTSVEAAIQAADQSSERWQETTSFFLIEHNGTPQQVANQIDTNSTLNTRTDLLVVINLSQKGYSIVGSYADKDIDKLLARR